jgi:hypothetical protein
MTKPPTLAETQGARLVAAHTNCNWVQLDPGGGKEQLSDFELRDGRGNRLGVLEVTSVVAGEVASFRNAERAHRIEDGRIRSTWFLVMKSPDINFKALSTVLPDLLIQAESNGFAPPDFIELIPGFNFNGGDEPQHSLAQAGVWLLCARPGASIIPGRVFVNPPSQGGAIGPDMVTSAVQVELNKQDNLLKLATAARGERAELLVWLDEGSASAALVSPRLFPDIASVFPTDGPVLPPPVTRVWAAVGPNDRDTPARGLWMAEGDLWQVIPSPPRLAM